MDFGPAASDYARHRAGFPPSFFARVALAGRVLDLGSGTGTLARGFAAQGASVVALDRSVAMLAQATGIAPRVAAVAEQLPFADESFDAVAAGQCWHWFDRPRAARECRRVLRPGGRLLIAHFDYLARDDNCAAEAERLILAANPSWNMAGSDGRYERWRPDLEGAGFRGIDSFEYEEDVLYSHDGWRGRIRACNGVIALRDERRIAELDAAVARLLADRFPEPLVVPHRVFAISGYR